MKKTPNNDTGFRLAFTHLACALCVTLGAAQAAMAQDAEDITEDETPPVEDVEEMPDVPEEPDVPDEPDVPPEDTGGLTGQYYDQINFTELRFERVDPGIEFDWNNDAPQPGMERTNLSVRWTGQVTPLYGELYTFHTISDDGSRLWVDGQLVVNNWFSQGATERVGNISLRAGQSYDIMVEYFQGGGGSSVEVLWSSPSQVREIIPGNQLDPETGLLEQTPQVSAVVIDPTATEGSADTAKVLIYRWGSLDETISVNLAYGGQVDPEGDFEATPQVVEIREGLSAVELELTPLNDDEREGTETLSVEVVDGQGYAISDATTVEITLNDDEVPPPQPVYAITGEVAYTGQPGPIVISAWNDAGMTDLATQRILIEPGAYSLSGLEGGTYHVSAFVDLDEDGTAGDGEPMIVVEGEPLTLPPDALGVDLIFPDERVDNGGGGGGGDEGCGCTTPGHSLPRLPAGGLAFALLLGAGLVSMRRRA